MEKEHSQAKSPFATEPIGRLIVKFAVPSVIALLVNSLYNIVDQIFIGWGVGYLGNGATNVVFPITIIALALSMMIGNGGARLFEPEAGRRRSRRRKKRRRQRDHTGHHCKHRTGGCISCMHRPAPDVVRRHGCTAALRIGIWLDHRRGPAFHDDLCRHQRHDPGGRQPQVRHVFHGHRRHPQRHSGPDIHFRVSDGRAGSGDRHGHPVRWRLLRYPSSTCRNSRPSGWMPTRFA